MGIVAKNINVGVNPPTVVEKEPVKKAPQLKAFAEIVDRKQSENVNKVSTKAAEQPNVETVQEPRYVHKHDGELIRHINRKSAYLRDLLELE